ncbi:transposase [Kitasatospora aureofaciens]|uniref:transposase n=1 Tax=Kitasatospora aureofaciens TaxID=1894 RepID=UPI001C441564|nr:transposase [Kitasatospora aureofaciens]MBV6703332.1 transposase [Kitasatospora aureofaciens]
MRSAGLPEVPEQTALVAAVAFSKGTLAMRVREKLAEVFADEPFTSAFGVRGAPGLSPGMLALVTVLQFAENLTDRQAAGMVLRAIDWKYAIGLELTDPGFDFTVLAKFRARLVEHGMERLVFDRLVEHCRREGLIAAGGKQRTDSTHVISAVRDLNRLELAGVSVRAVLEALATAPTWLGQAMPVAELELRYAARVDSWRLPSSKTKRDRLAEVHGQDALALLHAVHAPDAPVWLREIEAVQLLRQIFMQIYYVHTHARGREVVRKREAEKDGVPPGHLRLASPYELVRSGHAVSLCQATFEEVPAIAVRPIGSRPSAVRRINGGCARPGTGVGRRAWADHATAAPGRQAVTAVRRRRRR